MAAGLLLIYTLAASTIFGCKQTTINLTSLYMVLLQIHTKEEKNSLHVISLSLTVNDTSECNIWLVICWSLIHLFLSFKVNEWSLKIRKEMRVIDRQIRGEKKYFKATLRLCEA
jgi:hypothetical protein